MMPKSRIVHQEKKPGRERGRTRRSNDLLFSGLSPSDIVIASPEQPTDGLQSAWKSHVRSMSAGRKYKIEVVDLEPVSLLEEFDRVFNEEQQENLFKKAILEWRNKRKEKIEKGFVFAEKVLSLEQFPEGSCLKYIHQHQEEQNTQTLSSKPEVIALTEKTFLSTVPPLKENEEPLLGVIRPDGVVFYYHDENLKAKREFKISWADHYVKLNLNADKPFEIYRQLVADRYDREQKIVTLQEQSGHTFVRKRVEIKTDDLHDLEKHLAEMDEYLVKQGRFLSKKDKSSLLAYRENIRQQFEKAERICAYQVDAISRTAKIEGDVLESYAQKTHFISRKIEGVPELKVYVDRILPYKGKSLDVLLKPKSGDLPLTAEEKISIAWQCITLVSRLYDSNNSLSKKRAVYTHGHINSSHFCVTFEKDEKGKRIPKVSLIGFKEENPLEPEPSRFADGYLAPEAIEGKGKMEKNSYRLDIYALGVLLMGFENTHKMPKRGRHDRLGYVDPLAWRSDVAREDGLLSSISEAELSRLDESMQQQYNTLVLLANNMKQEVPAKRPALDEIKLAIGQSPALETLQKAIAEESNPAEREHLELVAKRVLALMHALMEHKMRHSQENESWFRSMFNFGWGNKAKKTVALSQAALNTTQVDLFKKELDRIMALVEGNAGGRDSFSLMLYRKLEEDTKISPENRRKLRKTVVDMVSPTVSPEGKARRDSGTSAGDGQTAEMSSDSSEKKVGFSRKISRGLSRRERKIYVDDAESSAESDGQNARNVLS